ncbi:hypothetical protein SANT12839_069400 [Streptomyces antimycoticus]|uniref:Uncharacterized protein n=1 Tax=Streptomyces antimycoticus TaxID=68175 RepID=A0A4D4KHM1_9ACTN|nr:hypothetical protein SANT12839_069400 [Streptomyces antimycoticus]
MGDATQLGWVKVALGIPPFLLCVYLTWIFLAKAPPPIDVIAEMEAEEKAERERKSQADKADKVVDPLLSEWTDQIVSEARTESADRQPPRH